MNIIIQFLLLILFITATKSYIDSNSKENVQSLLEFRRLKKYNTLRKTVDLSDDVEKAKIKSKIIAKARTEKKIKKYGFETINPLKKNREKDFKLDPVLNMAKRRAIDSSIETESSSREIQDWKDEWREKWLKKKAEAINHTTPRGDVVNMVAARPWGTQCGDPDQHDMPWGTCTLSAECEPEFRIFKGDYFCGRAPFVCCALMETSYDLYQGFDVSFADTSLETDSEERARQAGGSKEKKRRKKIRERKRRQRNRRRRKKKIQKKIRKIVREIKKLLNKAYKNGTATRKKKTKYLKKFIKKLKKQFKKDRKSVKKIHEIEMMKIDAKLQKKLVQMLGVNQNFMKNETYRDLLINGTVSKNVARMLAKKYPELSSDFDFTRRSGTNNARPPDYLDYDIEYGLLYY